MQAAEHAAAAGAGRLVLTHLTPDLDRGGLAGAGGRRRTTGPIDLAVTDDVFEVGVVTRPDGRGARRACGRSRYELGYQEWAAGSVLFSMGKTRVLVRRVRVRRPAALAARDRQGLGDGRVLDAARAPPERTPREVHAGPAGRTDPGDPAADRPRAPGVTDLRGIGERMITIDCDVLQADGGTRTASITGGLHRARPRASRARGLGAVLPGSA